MGALGVALIFTGYVLCYAAVANHGKFAPAPWQGLTADAYDDSAAPAPGSGKPGDIPPGDIGGGTFK